METRGDIKGLTREVDLGGSADRVKLDFEAYSIPDTMKIVAKNTGTVLFETGGPVTGRTEKRFDHEPGVNGSIVVANVVGSRAGTEWNLIIGCPGQEINNDDRATKVYRVFFSLEGGGSGVANCSYDFYVDGIKYSRTIGSTVGVTDGWGLDLTGGKEGSPGQTHWVSYANSSCVQVGGSGGTAKKVSYTVNFNKREVGSPGVAKYITVP